MTVKAAVIGTGYLGRFHAEKFAASPDAELVAVVDRLEERAAEIAAKVGATPLTDYRKLPEMGVQCASVVTNTSSHFEIAAFLLQNGIDVLIEKPMTSTIAQARELIQLAESNNRILQVGHLERFNPAFRAMKSALTKPQFFEARRIAPFSGRGFDVGVTLDLMIHDIDIIAHLVGRPIVKVEALGVPVLTDSVDIANARLTFEGGSVANVTASRAAFTTERTLRIFQPDVYISLDYGKRKLKISQRLEEQDERGFKKIEMHEETVEERDALQDEVNAFVQCVRDRVAPEVSAYDGLRALEIAELINKSLASHDTAPLMELPA